MCVCLFPVLLYRSLRKAWFPVRNLLQRSLLTSLFHRIFLEILLGSTLYTRGVDIWAVATILGKVVRYFCSKEFFAGMVGTTVSEGIYQHKNYTFDSLQLTNSQTILISLSSTFSRRDDQRSSRVPRHLDDQPDRTHH